MPLTHLRILAVIALIALPVRQTSAKEPPHVSDGSGATAGRGQTMDPALSCSWLPTGIAMGDLGWNRAKGLGSDLDSAGTSWFLIEQAEHLLETPRPARLAVSRPLQDVDTPAARDEFPARNMFSQSWSDGAPLLFFDWSGKSSSSDGPPGLKLDGVKRVAHASTATDWGDVTSKVKLRERDAHLDPAVSN